MYFLHPVKMEKIKEMMKSKITDKKIMIYAEDTILDGNHRVATFMIKNNIKKITIDDLKENFDVIDIGCCIPRLSDMLYEYFKTFKVKKILNPYNNQPISVTDIPKEIPELEWFDFVEKEEPYEDLYWIINKYFTPIPIEAEIDYSKLKEIIDVAREIQRVKKYIKITDRQLTKEEFEEYVTSVLKSEGKFILDTELGLSYTNPNEWLVVYPDKIILRGDGCLEGVEDIISDRLDMDLLYERYLKATKWYDLVLTSDGIRIRLSKDYKEVKK